MSRFTLISVIALALVLVGATAVFAQSQTLGTGRGMMQFPATSQPTQTTPAGPAGPQGGGSTTPIGPGMMGNGYGPNGTGGYGMMNGANWDAMRQAMQSGNLQQMYDACRNAWQNSSTQPPTGTQGPQTQSAPATGTGSQSRPAARAATRTRGGMMS